MTDMDWAPPLGERLTRLETLFEANLANQARREDQETLRRSAELDEQRRRDEIAAEERRELSICVRSLMTRLDKFEPVILGDAALGQKSLGARLETVERVILSAKVGWRTATFIGAAVVGLISAMAYLLNLAPALPWTGSSTRH